LTQPSTLRFSASATADPADLLTEQLPTIEQVVAGLANRYRLSTDEEADLRSLVLEKLIENDYRILTRFEGRSSWASYLAIVIANLFRDHRVREWGRWRPSAASRRAGAIGVRLETLIRRDGHTIDQAIQVLGSEGPCEMSDRDLAALASTFPKSVRPRFQSLEEHPVDLAGSLGANDELDRTERKREAGTVLGAVEAALDGLEQEDRVILRLRYWEGSSIADIARALGLDQRPLYRRMNALLLDLREKLQERGVSGTHVQELLGEAE